MWSLKFLWRYGNKCLPGPACGLCLNVSVYFFQAVSCRMFFPNAINIGSSCIQGFQDNMELFYSFQQKKTKENGMYNTNRNFDVFHVFSARYRVACDVWIVCSMIFFSSSSPDSYNGWKTDWRWVVPGVFLALQWNCLTKKIVSYKPETVLSITSSFILLISSEVAADWEKHLFCFLSLHKSWRLYFFALMPFQNKVISNSADIIISYNLYFHIYFPDLNIQQHCRIWISETQSISLISVDSDNLAFFNGFFDRIIK